MPEASVEGLGFTDETEVEVAKKATPEAKAAKPKGEKVAKVTKAMFQYRALLSAFPIPGGGGAHVGMYKAGILGYSAGVDEEQIIKDIRANIKRGGRVVLDKEIVQSVHAGFVQAVEEKTGIKTAKAAKRPPKIPAGTFEKIVAANKGVTVEDIIAKSPVPLDFPEWEAGWRTIDALYLPDDYLYIGGAKEEGVIGENMRLASDWTALLMKEPPKHPHIIANPFTGESAPTKDGSHQTYRGDNCIRRFQHMVVEMDHATLEDQLAFWSYIALPVRALIMSGGKSIHGWVDVSCEHQLEWELEVESDLFPSYLAPLGADESCKNESRVSRMPGHTRPATDKYPNAVQRLIYLSPEGKAVCE